MQPPPMTQYPPAPRLSVPLWGKILLGCGALSLLLFLLAVFGISRIMVSGRSSLQTGFCFQSARAAQRGLTLYAQDYDQTLPLAKNWVDSATPYVKGKTDFKCPALRKTNSDAYGYAFNSKLAGSRQSKIVNPNSVYELYDSTNLTRNASDPATSLPIPARHTLQGARRGEHKPRQGNVIVFADGHTKFIGTDGTEGGDALLEEAPADGRSPITPRRP